MNTATLSGIANEIAETRTHEVWVVTPGSKIAITQMTEADAVAVYEEFVRQYRAENWNLIDVHRIPKRLSKLQNGGELTVVGVVNTANCAPVTLPHWLTRVPSKAVSA